MLKIEHIAATPNVYGGKPRIVGSRVRVEAIVSLTMNDGWLVEQIADQLDLTLAQVHAALAYYYDHQAEIDADIAAGRALLDSLAPESEARRQDLITRAKGITPPEDSA